MKKVFIHTNNKQLLGAKLAKYAIEKHLPEKSAISVEFINVDELYVFKNFAGKKYRRAGRELIYNPLDLQSFTLSRFMPPQLTNYQGRAVVIDPDIFAVADISELLEMDLGSKAIAACRKKDAWDTSMMVMECSKLKHWAIDTILSRLETEEIDYAELITLKPENQETIMEMPRIWNNLDKLTADTKMVHMTNRLTQPWKTGLPIDFTINPLPKIFGLVPREPIHKLLGKYPTHYQGHPDKNIEAFFLNLVKEATKAGAVTKEGILQEIKSKHVRQDLLAKLPSFAYYI